MAKIATPPDRAFTWSWLAREAPDLLDDYMQWLAPTDSKGRYLHYEELKRRVVRPLDPEVVWAIVKQARLPQQQAIISLGEPATPCHLVLTPSIQKALSETDQNATEAALQGMANRLGEGARPSYLLQDLIEDESISSSQLEGAATTTRVAKDMLKRQRQPRTQDEKMILGNYRMMVRAWEFRDQPLDPDFIRELHHIGVEGIDDHAYHPGQFRDSDDVVVVDHEGNTVHTPPPARRLERRLQRLSEWANTDHNPVDSALFIHPLIKAIVLHFAIGYEHPFHDGNGRVARALFYWFLFKAGFPAFRYISISLLLKKAPAQYARSYLYTETDDMDLTYFVASQCDVVVKAIHTFRHTCEQATREIELFNRWLWESGLYRQLNDKQRTVFQVARSGIARQFTTRTVENNLGCSYNTAASVLNGLVALKLFRKRKEGREWVYTMADRDEIIRLWG